MVTEAIAPQETGIGRRTAGLPAVGRARRIALGLSFAISASTVVASTLGLFADGMYRDGAWAREALRGGDLTALALVVPVLACSAILAARGSVRAEAVWIGALAYGVYNYAYYVFGASFNDLFLVHVVLLTLSMWATVLAAASIDPRAVARAYRLGWRARWIGGFLVAVGVILGGLWVTLAIRFAVTGELMADVPVDGVHLVFAVDLSLLVPALIVGGALLWRRSAIGVVFGAAMVVMGTLYQVNLLVAGVFQAAADVPGVKAFPPEGVGVALGFAMASIALFVHGGPGRRVAARRSMEEG